MKKTKLKNNQEIHANITRIYDEQNEEYHFMRNETKIVFGKGYKLLGRVFMTNPGSFDFKYNKSSVLEACSQNYSNTPDGYIRIYN